MFSTTRINTYGFQTREGREGMLQVVNANLARGVKIRYKLIQGGPSRTDKTRHRLSAPPQTPDYRRLATCYFGARAFPLQTLARL